MSPYSTPGVYIKEVSTGPRPIESVGTSVAGFAGVPPLSSALVGVPRAITNWSTFLKLYSKEGASSTPLARAVHGFFQNGGPRCYVLNVGKSDQLAGDGKGNPGLAAFEAIDDIAIVAAPGFVGAANYDLLLSHAEKLGDRVAILDAPETVEELDRLTKVGQVGAASSKPPGDSAPSGGAGEAASRAKPPKDSGLRPRESDGGYGAFYYPWIRERDPLDPKSIVTSPPSGHMAGIYARNDALRGVHKAPANETIRGALGLVRNVSRSEQGALNRVGVNCIRFFPDRGTRVWGARTLAASASEWRYLNVRRLFNMVEESIEQATVWTVFEPNDRSLWKKIRRDVGAYLMNLWRDGALLGATPEEAFFVQCDEETNPREVIDAGRVEIRVGIAPTKPAEFVVFRIGQYAPGMEDNADN